MGEKSGQSELGFGSWGRNMGLWGGRVGKLATAQGANRRPASPGCSNLLRHFPSVSLQLMPACVSTGTALVLVQVGASVGHVPKMSFGRARYDLEGLGLREGELVPGARTLSPQAQEVASRTYVAGES